MKRLDKKTSNFARFKYNFFKKKVPPDADSLFKFINPTCINDLSEEEKEAAEEMLIIALEKEYQKRWIWGLTELGSKKGYEIMLYWFENTKAIPRKVTISHYLLSNNIEAPVLDFLLQEVNENTNEKVLLEIINTFSYVLEQMTDNRKKSQVIAALEKLMTSEHLHVRVCAYSELVSCFGLKDFIPINDEIDSLIKQKDNATSYKKAVKILDKRIKSKRQFLFTRQKIQDFLFEISYSQTKSEEPCSYCQDIPDKLYADLTVNTSLKNYYSKLETAVSFAYYKDCIRQCPKCKQLFLYYYHYEYFIAGQSEEEEELLRVKPKKAMILVDTYIRRYNFKRIIVCENKMKIDY